MAPEAIAQLVLRMKPPLGVDKQMWYIEKAAEMGIMLTLAQFKTSWNTKHNWK